METNAASAIQQVVIAIIPLIFAITLHEAAHGWVASKLGDKTALMLGRVTLNPVKHIDLLGTIILPILMLFIGGFVFGWAKPVPVSWQNLRHPRRDMALVAVAGPLMNLLMALLWAIVAKISYLVLHDGITYEWLRTTMNFLQLAAIFGIGINCILLILNLLPIPPLDGSRIISSLLPPGAAHAYERIEPYGIWILLGLFALGVLSKLLLPLVFVLMTLIKSLFGINF